MADGNDYIKLLQEMFGDSVTNDVLETVLSSCNNDVQQTIDTLLNMSLKENNKTKITTESSASTPPPPIPQANKSYSCASQSKVIRKKTEKLTTPTNKKMEMNVQLKQIVDRHEAGHRVIVLMRGAPGSGKTTLAHQIVDCTVGPSQVNYSNHIFSADNYFYRNGVYYFDVSRLGEAHDWNNKSVDKNLSMGVSPVIVDNTNVKLWELERPLRTACKNGYYIEIFDANTPWAKNASHLARKNTHNVPYSKIVRMLENYEPSGSVNILLQKLNLQYTLPYVPPVYRNIPPYVPKSLSETLGDDTNVENEDDNVILIEDEKESLELQWEEGEQWAENENIEITTDNQPKPRRERNSKHHQHDQPGPSMMSQINDSVEFTDWQQIVQTVPLCDYSIESHVKDRRKDSVASTVGISVGTSVERGDTDIVHSRYKILAVKSRDINFYHIPSNSFKIPLSVMLDKSSMTVENFDIERPVIKCKNEDKHFVEFTKMFKNIDEDVLKDVFDKCCGDVNWASELLLDGIPPEILETVVGAVENQAGNHECDYLCECVSNYHIKPNKTLEPVETSPIPLHLEVTKKKKEKKITAESAELIRQLEKSIDIADYHYSNHCLTIKKLRHGDNANPNSVQLGNLNIPSNSENVNPNPEEEVKPKPDDSSPPTTEDELNAFISNLQETSEDPNETLDINVGAEFIRQVVKVVEKRTDDVTYPDFIVPVVNIPKSFVNYLYAMWMESIAHQVDANAMYNEIMIKEDEELARKLAEEDISDEEDWAPVEAPSQPNEPDLLPEETEVELKEPDLREIMDHEKALSVAAKEATLWRNGEPNDLASKLTREKLHNLFPDINKDVLAELLVAHENKFQNTVEALLISTGQAALLARENAVAQFVHEREAQIQQELQTQLEDLGNEEWLGLPDDNPVRLETVQEYRQMAKAHLDARNESQNKAKMYISRGMTSVAAYHIDLAAKDQLLFEQSSSMAASALIQMQATNKSPDTLDLHYLRVIEALEALDMFLDHHLDLLARGIRGRRFTTLFLVTGRGLHSRNGPRVKPAVEKRLRQRDVRFNEVNPGLLSVCLNENHKMTHEL